MKASFARSGLLFAKWMTPRPRYTFARTFGVQPSPPHFLMASCSFFSALASSTFR